MNPTDYNLGPFTIAPPIGAMDGGMTGAMDDAQGGMPGSSVPQPQAQPDREQYDGMPEDYMPAGPIPTRGPQLNRNYFVDNAQARDIANSLPNNPTDPQMASYLTNLLRQKESSGNYQAVNPRSTASGAYQYTDGTWNGYGGYAKAALAPPDVQDRRFAQDVQARLAAYGDDPYKAIVAHYLPALANQPQKWAQPFSVGGRAVKPALSYLRYVVHGSPLEAGLDAYLHRGIRPQLPSPQFASAN